MDVYYFNLWAPLCLVTIYFIFYYWKRSFDRENNIVSDTQSSIYYLLRTHITSSSYTHTYIIYTHIIHTYIQYIAYTVYCIYTHHTVHAHTNKFFVCERVFIISKHCLSNPLRSCCSVSLVHASIYLYRMYAKIDQAEFL